MTEPANGRLEAFLRLIRYCEDGFLIVLLGAMIGLAVTQIVLRNLFDSGLSWADPLLRLLVLWVGLAGAMVATRQDRHIAIDVLTRYLPPRWQLAAQVIVDLFAALVSAIVAYHAGRLVIMDKEAGAVAFAAVPVWICELIIPLAFGVIAMRYLVFTITHARQLLTNEPRVDVEH
jgi:TRAP-type C4-dicarboxylate transport system permease small subunit